MVVEEFVRCTFFITEYVYMLLMENLNERIKEGWIQVKVIRECKIWQIISKLIIFLLWSYSVCALSLGLTDRDLQSKIKTTACLLLEIVLDFILQNTTTCKTLICILIKRISAWDFIFVLNSLKIYEIQVRLSKRWPSFYALLFIERY